MRRKNQGNNRNEEEMSTSSGRSKARPGIKTLKKKKDDRSEGPRCGGRRNAKRARRRRDTEPRSATIRTKKRGAWREQNPSRCQINNLGGKTISETQKQGARSKDVQIFPKRENAKSGEKISQKEREGEDSRAYGAKQIRRNSRVSTKDQDKKWRPEQQT